MTLSLQISVFEELKVREQKDLDRIHQLIRLVTLSKCFNFTLAQHFGSGLLSRAQKCGHCQWCESHKAVTLHDAEPIDFDEKAFETILRECPARDDPRYLARIACGITSPRTGAEKFSGKGGNAVFGSMQFHDFEVGVSIATTASVNFFYPLKQNMLADTRVQGSGSKVRSGLR